MFIDLAWRNIWRNPRRTAVILCAVVVGVWSMVFLGAMMRGMTDQMIRNGIATLTGHLQIHQQNYRDDPVIENSIPQPGAVEASLGRLLPPGAHWSARVRVPAIAQNARNSAGVTLVGIDPGAEARVSFIGGAVDSGRYLEPGDHYGVVVGRALLKKFETRLGHKLVVMSQDRQGQIASRAFRIVGVFRAEMESTEKQFIFVTLPAARKMLKLKGGISEISILLPPEVPPRPLARRLAGALPSSLRVQTWRELLPLLVAYVQLMNGFTLIWYLVVFVAMAFGIINTTLMAVFERIREFGLLKALGMRPGWIVREVLAESFFLLVLGQALGNALALVMVAILDHTGIDLSALAAGSEFFGMARVLYPALRAGDLALANLVVFFLGLLVSVYPAAKAARFTPVEALAHT